MKYSKIRGIPASLKWNSKFVGKLRDKEYRHAYMVEGVRSWLARQIRLLREDRGWSQSDLGNQTGKPQSAISRLEDADYGRLSLQSLFDLAAAFDVAVLVQFVGWNDWLGQMDDVTANAMRVESFDERSLIGRHQVGTSLKVQVFGLGGTAEFNHTSSFLTMGGGATPAFYRAPEIDPMAFSLGPVEASIVLAQTQIGGVLGHG
jgi:transcriptional regulator with XRE-family HTH domain